MSVTLPGIVTLAKLVQLLKALSPMLVTLSGIVMLVNPVQPWKEYLLMLDPLVITITNEVGFAWFATLLVFSVEPVMLVKLMQPPNA